MLRRIPRSRRREPLVEDVVRGLLRGGHASSEIVPSSAASGSMRMWRTFTIGLSIFSTRFSHKSLRCRHNTG